MKQPQILSVLAAVSLTISMAQAAVPSFEGELDGDLYYQSGVLLRGVEPPTDTNATSGESSVLLGGSGTLTVGNQAGGGFPRVTVLGGTTISSSRTWNEDASRKTWWDGQFSAPGSGRLPSQYDINYSTVNALGVVGAFSWGLANETFRFSTPAKAVFPVDAADGQKLLVAYKSGESWTATATDFCVVENELCYVELTEMSDLAFVKEVYQTCPIKSVTNGSTGSVPSCIISCDRDFELNEAATGCISSGGEEFMDEDGDELYEADEDGFGDEHESANYYEEDEGPAYEFPAGYFRYNGTSDQKGRVIDTSELEGDELKRANMLNRGHYSRNPRSADQQIKKEEVAVNKDEENDSFINYLLQMRNTFSNEKMKEEIASAEIKRVEGAAAESEALAAKSEENDEDKEEATFHSGAPLLPSTGPEVFVTIAVIGFLMMLFGARRRN